MHFGQSEKDDPTVFSFELWKVSVKLTLARS